MNTYVKEIEKVMCVCQGDCGGNEHSCGGEHKGDDDLKMVLLLSVFFKIYGY